MPGAKRQSHVFVQALGAIGRCAGALLVQREAALPKGIFFCFIYPKVNAWGFLLRAASKEGKMKETVTNERNQRVVTFLNREEVDFLDKLGKDALFTAGAKLSRAKLIAWLVDMLKGLNISGENLKSEEDLERRVVAALQHLEEK
jgi:hypothetical protein